MHSNKVGSKPYTLKTKSITNKLYSKALKHFYFFLIKNNFPRF